jgi:hypothetical protein|tara:strand:+ start:115 stop:324 length:210 start_codon:yes stop_codon:yes gene_type:complete
MKTILSFGAIVSVLHFFEDAALLVLGRYTEVNIYILFIGTILFGFLVAAVAKIPWVHKLWHASDRKEHD